MLLGWIKARCAVFPNFNSPETAGLRSSRCSIVVFSSILSLSTAPTNGKPLMRFPDKSGWWINRSGLTSPSASILHCCFTQPGEEIQIGPNWDLSKALNNLYRLLLRIDRYPGHFGVLLIKMHLLAFVVVAIKWIIRPKTMKNLFS